MVKEQYIKKITIVNVYALNQAPKYITQKLTEPKEGINSNTVIVRNFNAPFLTMDRSFRQRINKETANLKNTIDQIILADIYRTIHRTTAAYTFFWSSYGIFSSINHMLSHKTILSKFMKIKIIPNIFPDYNGMIPEINNRIINTKFSNILPKNRRKENAAQLIL